MARWRHGYRVDRNPEYPLPKPPDVLSIQDTILGSDAVARIVQEAARLAPAPSPEILLVMWARQYYAGGGDVFVYQIGLYVAEDLRLNGRLGE